MPTPPPPDTWWEDHWRDYSNEEHFIFEIRNLGHQGDFLLYLPYWLILVVITPPWWALILWVACRHEKAVELASGQGEIPAAPEPGET